MRKIKQNISTSSIHKERLKRAEDSVEFSLLSAEFSSAFVL